MHQGVFAGQWKQAMAAAREYWAGLTDADIQRAQAGREHLADVIQERYGRSREEAEREIDEFLRQHPRKGLFEKMAEINGNLKINQYVSNPAPGPSKRPDRQ